MHLTQKQEWLIDRYLRAVENEMDDVDDAARARAAAHVKSQVLYLLKTIPSEPHRDEDLVLVFQKLGSPASQAAQFVSRYGERGAFALAQYDRVWLGVCAGIAQYFRLKPAHVRYGAIALGVTGPIALCVYLALYIEMYMNTAPGTTPAFQVRRVLIAAGGTVAALVAIHYATRLAPLPFRKLYALFAPGAVPELGRWDWLVAYRGDLLFYALALSTPMAALAATPMAGNWDATLAKIGKSIVAVYAVVLCLGLASQLAGLLLSFIEKTTWV